MDTNRYQVVYRTPAGWYKLPAVADKTVATTQANGLTRERYHAEVRPADMVSDETEERAL